MKGLNRYLLLFLCFAVYQIEGKAVGSKTKPKRVPVKYDGAQLWRVETAKDKIKNIINSLENDYDIATWKSNNTHTDLFLKHSAIKNVSRIFDTEKIRYSVLIRDLQEKIDAERPKQLNFEHRYQTNHHLNWTAYHGTRAVYRFLHYLVQTYPNLSSVLTIGYTSENRQLKVLRISNRMRNRNPAIWIDGGMHAREWVSTAAITYIINDIVMNWSNQSEIIQNINWYFQPIVNPDGYEYTRTIDRLWRKNRSGSGDCIGVDLNRNYGYHWAGLGTSNDTCSDYYRGTHAFSEAETRAQKDFFRLTEEKFYGFVTFHNYGQRIFYPWAYNATLTPDHDDLRAFGQTAAEAIYSLNQKNYTVGPSAILRHPAAGAADDWAKNASIKYTYSVELRDNGENGFTLPPSLIIPIAEEAFQFVRTLAAAVRNYTNKNF